MDKGTFKVFVTRYALTKGIVEQDVTPTNYPEMVKGDGLFEHYHGEGRQWHRTRESAVAKAEEMRKKKIAGLQKQIRKLEQMRFA